MKTKDDMGSIEEALGNVRRLRILRFLARSVGGEESLSRYKLKRLTGIETKEMERHLSILVDKGWVEEIRINQRRKYRLNKGDPRVEALARFFEKIGYI